MWREFRGAFKQGTACRVTLKQEKTGLENQLFREEHCVQIHTIENLSRNYVYLKEARLKKVGRPIRRQCGNLGKSRWMVVVRENQRSNMESFYLLLSSQINIHVIFLCVLFI